MCPARPPNRRSRARRCAAAEVERSRAHSRLDPSRAGARRPRLASPGRTGPEAERPPRPARGAQRPVYSCEYSCTTGGTTADERSPERRAGETGVRRDARPSRSAQAATQPPRSSSTNHNSVSGVGCRVGVPRVAFRFMCRCPRANYINLPLSSASLLILSILELLQKTAACGRGTLSLSAVVCARWTGRARRQCHELRDAALVQSRRFATLVTFGARPQGPSHALLPTAAPRSSPSVRPALVRAHFPVRAFLAFSS